MNFFDFLIYQPLGWVLKFCYDITTSYGLAIILFTIIVKVILMPLGVKQQHGVIKQIKIRPKEDLIRKKYAQDKELLNKKIMELYKKEGYNPAGGCLPMLIQLPVIWALYRIINKPLTYIQKIDADTIVKIEKALGIAASKNGYNEIKISSEIALHYDKVKTLLPDNFHPISFNFLGMDLSSMPSINHINMLLLIPLFAAVTAYASGKISQRAMAYTSAGANNTTMKSMNIFSPLMSLFITFTLPAGVGLYWTISNMLMMGQSWVLNLIFDPAKAAEEAKENIRRAVEMRKKRKADTASKKSSDIEARKLADKNMRRKKAGLPPLQSLDGAAAENTDEPDDTNESDESNEPDESDSSEE